MKRKPTALIALLIALSTFAACGNDEDDTGAQETHTSASGVEFNEADVAFATDMMQHHAQALQMVDMTMGRKLDPAVQELVEGVRAAQTPEIETMNDWLVDWDQPVPETARDHANAHNEGGSDMDHEMPGMMSTEDMDELEAAKGEEFQKMWLEMMIEHHEGAIEMAETEQAEGVNEAATRLAESIEATQREEIATMEGLLDS